MSTCFLVALSAGARQGGRAIAPSTCRSYATRKEHARLHTVITLQKIDDWQQMARRMLWPALAVLALLALLLVLEGVRTIGWVCWTIGIGAGLAYTISALAGWAWVFLASWRGVQSKNITVPAEYPGDETPLSGRPAQVMGWLGMVLSTALLLLALTIPLGLLPGWR